MKLTTQKLSNFINCRGGYFNKGKYKGKNLNTVPIKYLLWVQKNFTNLNKTEIKILKVTIDNKLNKQI